MIHIYLDEGWMGLPGYYFLYQGAVDEYLQLKKAIEQEILAKQGEILLNGLSYIEVQAPDWQIIFRYSKNENWLCKMQQGQAITAFTKQYWEVMLEGLDNLIACPSSATQEFSGLDNKGFVEDAFFIFET